jgi:hypothetical protein
VTIINRILKLPSVYPGLRYTLNKFNDNNINRDQNSNSDSNIIAIKAAINHFLTRTVLIDRFSRHFIFVVVQLDNPPRVCLNY